MLPHIIEESLSCSSGLPARMAQSTTRPKTCFQASENKGCFTGGVYFYFFFLESGEVNRCATGEIDGEP